VEIFFHGVVIPIRLQDEFNDPEESQNFKGPKIPNNHLPIWNFAIGASLAFGGLAFEISRFEFGSF
jgi:hypothetical protein